MASFNGRTTDFDSVNDGSIPSAIVNIFKGGFTIEEKTCPICGRELPLDMFAYRNKKKRKRRYDCKECASKREKEKHARNTSKVNELKEKLGCVKCKDKRYYLIDFHHLNPNEKENTVARLVIHASIKDTINELKKCVPLCTF